MGSETSDSQCWYLPTNRVLHSQWYRNQALCVTITSARSVTAQEPPGTPDTVHSWYFCTRFFVGILSCSPSPRKNKPLYEGGCLRYCLRGGLLARFDILLSVCIRDPRKWLEIKLLVEIYILKKTWIKYIYFS